MQFLLCHASLLAFFSVSLPCLPTYLPVQLYSVHTSYQPRRSGQCHSSSSVLPGIEHTAVAPPYKHPVFLTLPTTVNTCWRHYYSVSTRMDVLLPVDCRTYVIPPSIKCPPCIPAFRPPTRVADYNTPVLTAHLPAGLPPHYIFFSILASAYY